MTLHEIDETGVTAVRSSDALGWFHFQIGVTRSLTDRSDLAISSYRRAWEICHARNSDWFASNAAANLAAAYARRGDPNLAQNWLDVHSGYQIRPFWWRNDVDLGAHAAAATLALDRLDEEEARRRLSELGDHRLPADLWPLITQLQAEYALFFGDPRAGLAQLDAVMRTNASLTEGSIAPTLLARARSDLLLASGDGGRARKAISALPRRHAMLSVAEARILLVAGHYSAARRVTAGALSDPGLTDRDRLDLQLIESAAQLGMGAHEPARIAMIGALETYAGTGILREFATLPAEWRQRLFAVAGRHLTDADRARLASAATGIPGPARVDPALRPREGRSGPVRQGLLPSEDRWRTLPFPQYREIASAALVPEASRGKSRDALTKAVEFGLLDP